MKRIAAIAAMSFALACSSTQKTEDSTATGGMEANAAAGDDAQALRASAEEGCVASMTKSNAEGYAKRMMEDGAAEEAAVAEGQEAMRLAKPILQKTCGCALDAILAGEELTSEHVQGTWVAEQLAAKMDDPAVQSCMSTMAEDMKAFAPEMKKGLEAFREKQSQSG